MEPDFQDLVALADAQMAVPGIPSPEPFESEAVVEPEAADPEPAVEPEAPSAEDATAADEGEVLEGDRGAEAGAVLLDEKMASALVTVPQPDGEDRLVTVAELIEAHTASLELNRRGGELDDRERALAARGELSDVDRRIVDAVRTNPVDTAILLLEQNPTLATSRGVTLPGQRQPSAPDDDAYDANDPWGEPAPAPAAQATAPVADAAPAWAAKIEARLDAMASEQAAAERRRSAEEQLRALPERLGVPDLDTQAVLQYAVAHQYGDLAEAAKAYMFDHMKDQQVQAGRRRSVSPDSIPQAARDSGVVTHQSRTPRASNEVDVTGMSLEEIVQQAHAEMLA